MDKRKVFILGIIIGSFFTTATIVFGIVQNNPVKMMIFGCVVFFMVGLLSNPFVRWLDK